MGCRFFTLQVIMQSTDGGKRKIIFRKQRLIQPGEDPRAFWLPHQMDHWACLIQFRSSHVLSHTQHLQKCMQEESAQSPLKQIWRCLPVEHCSFYRERSLFLKELHVVNRQARSLSEEHFSEGQMSRKLWGKVRQKIRAGEG